MSIRLVYHDLNSRQSLSAFDEAIVAIAREGDELRLTCPYLGVSYLERLTRLSSSWRLITDIEEWFCTLPHIQREYALDILERSPQSVRHLSRLHSKVVIGAKTALLGSANLTRSGICERTEMSIVLDDHCQVEELQRWFERAWIEAVEVPEDLDWFRSEMRKLPERSMPKVADTGGVFPKVTPITYRMLDLLDSGPWDESSSENPTESEFVDHLPANLRSIYLEIKRRAKTFAPYTVDVRVTRQYLAFRAGKNFAEIHSRKDDFDVHIRGEGFAILEGGTSRVHGIDVTRVPDTHEWAINHKFAVNDTTPMDGVEKLLRQSYDTVTEGNHLPSIYPSSQPTS